MDSWWGRFGSGHAQQATATTYSHLTDLAISNMYNGKACSSCYAPGHKSCGNNGTIRCEGAIDQCAYITGTVSEGNITIPFAARGCASEGACNIKPNYQLKSGVFRYVFETVNCSPAPSSAVQTRVWGSHLLPSLAGLLLVKSIY
ncbi:hypothetical protein Y1Q_0003399 [Alligator mississippiensis]|uniref:Uncharacterized protein n=1 Tax=Alligator mississippiensis TaxID=8496 RepID=A0A151M3V4_ALLMI|nr:hypothetical protein Y1Q_0003399 [Alligator mississippiensis]